MTTANESLNVYNVQFGSETNENSGGSFSYVSDGHFNVNIKENREGSASNSYSDMEILAHEFKHAEQYETRQLGFKRIKSTGVVLPYAYDLNDEIEAALQANLFDVNSSTRYDDIKKVIADTQSKYMKLPRTKTSVFQQHYDEVTNKGKIPNSMTIDERNARPNTPMTIIYNRNKGQ